MTTAHLAFIADRSPADIIAHQTNDGTAKIIICQRITGARSASSLERGTVPPFAAPDDCFGRICSQVPWVALLFRLETFASHDQSRKSKSAAARKEGLEVAI